MGLAVWSPRRLVPDQEANYESPIVQNLYTLCPIDPELTSHYHPAGNGGCEGLKETIKPGFQKMLNEERLEECDVGLPELIFA